MQLDARENGYGRSLGSEQLVYGAAYSLLQGLGEGAGDGQIQAYRRARKVQVLTLPCLGFILPCMRGGDKHSSPSQGACVHSAPGVMPHSGQSRSLALRRY